MRGKAEEAKKSDVRVVLLLWEKSWQLFVVFPEKNTISKNTKGLAGFATVCILSHSQTIYLSVEFAPGKSHTLGKGGVHSSD